MREFSSVLTDPLPPPRDCGSYRRRATSSPTERERECFSAIAEVVRKLHGKQVSLR